MLLATYRLYRSNAIWYSKRLDGYGITLRKKHTGEYISFKFSKGESLKWAKTWMTKARSTWSSLSKEQKQVLTTCKRLGVQTAEVSRSGEVKVLSVQDAALNPATDCLCPECTEKAIAEYYRKVSSTWANLTFPGKDILPGSILEEREDSADETAQSKGVLL